MSSNRAGAFMGGFLIGAAVGAITGLLLAPRSGRETRQFLKKSADALPEIAEDLSTSVQLQADRLSESALRRWDGTLVRLREAIAAGLEASQEESHTPTDSPTESSGLNQPPQLRTLRDSSRKPR
ncbi:gas vesicle protein [Leptolyngbya sp. 'hensonii']|uniref:YtxH domain-containing protein n=1 Tax=Leptolyngbya sp. 'hensonii' TaxID=1922337 RepID=UPI00094FDF4E|nr:YtxH domain-containing protein [Leptolyngbya sp. 'hensonii']OLP16128.1 gas vesicle protein [Leptolyngbya sp. 'hensonii']